MRKNIKSSSNEHRLAGVAHHGGHHRLGGSALAMMVFREIKE
jgi:hypothetical protein